MSGNVGNPTPSSDEVPISDRLDSWKEIASYIKRDVRTAQRWEKQEGLPIHRIQHDTQGTVFAYKSEIDAWWRNHERHTGQTESTEHTVGEARWYTRLLGAASPAQLVVPIVVAIGMASVGIVALIWYISKTPPELIQRQLTENSSMNPLDDPVISPDGKYFAYCEATGISIEQIDTSEIRLLDHTAGLCPQDWLDGTRLLANGPGTMWTVSLLNGNTRKLWDIEGSAAVSPDGSHIALTGVIQGRRGIWLTRADGLQLDNVLTTNDYIVAFSWSPDGKRFAYIRSPFLSTNAWLESRDLDGKNVTTVLEDGRLYSSSTDAGLCWLPDGRLIFSRQEDPPNYRDSNLWAIETDPSTGRTEGKPYRLTHFNDFAWMNLSVSRDGKRLVARKARLVSSIYTGEFNAEGSRLRFIHRLTTDNWSYSIGGWTPVSDAVLLHGRRLGQYQIYKQTLNEHVPEVLLSSTENYLWPEYSPDKSWILFWSSETDTLHQPLRLMRLSRNGGRPEVVLTASPNSSFHCGRLGKTCVLRENRTGKAVFSALDPSQGKGAVLAQVEASFVDAHSWSLSPDGNSIAYVESPDLGLQMIRVLQLETGKIGKITLEKFTPEHVAWSHDGTVLFITGWANSEWQLARVARDGKINVLDHNQRVIWFPSPSPDGKKIAFAKDTDEFNVALLENF